MAYTRLHWVESETPLSAQNMNNIEDGIEELQAEKEDKVEGKSLSTNDYTDEEKTKLENIENFAKRNQLAWSGIQFGSEVARARNTEDVFPLEFGDLMNPEIEFHYNAPDDPRLTKLKIGVNKNAVASTSSNGLMSKSDKAKLDGITAGANAVKVVKHTVSSATLDASESTGRVTVTASQSGYSLAGIVGVKIYGPNEGMDRIVRGSTISHMEYPISSTQFEYVIDNGGTASITYAVDFYLLYVKN